MTFRSGFFKLGDLRRLGRLPPDDPPLRIGDRATLNSGSPIALVVDADDENVTLSWREGGQTHEQALPRACVRRSPVA